MIWALTSQFTEWDADHARQSLLAQRIDIPTELRRANAALEPVVKDWLARRLQIVWKSSTPTNAMAAKEWLHETGRLIKHLPHDIVAHAIDQAVCKSRFTPTAADILAIANPLLEERRVQRARLHQLVNGVAERKPHPWETQEKPFKEEDRCTPEQAAAIIAEVGLDLSVEPERGFGIDASKLRMPSAAELEALATEFNGTRPT